jgi:succinoglycan biosynthesis transport protein ExoP
MNNLEKYLDQVIEQKPIVYEPPVEAPKPPPEEAPPVNVLASVRRRWYIVLAATVVLCALALPAIFLLVEPQHVVQGAVRVAPVVEGVLTEEANPAEIGSYSGFVNTQAILLMSNGEMLQRIADDLAGRNLSFFGEKPQSRIARLKALLLPANRKIGPERILREAISENTITAYSIPGTELIGVSMRSTNVDEAKTIVDSFLRNYVAQYGNNSQRKDTGNLNFLSGQRDELFKKIMNQREQINALAKEYGGSALTAREEMEMSRQTALLGELTRLESQKISAEATVSLYEQTDKVDLSPEQIVRARREYVNSDPMVAELSRSIVGTERDLIVAEQTLNAGHPALVRLQATLGTFRKTLDNKRKELEQEYDSGLEGREKEAARQRLAAAQMEQARIQAYYDTLLAVLDQQDTKTRQVGLTNLDIQDRQFKLQVDQELYDQLSRRIKTLEMEQQRPARVETAYFADVTSTNDRRPQLAMAALLGALACGFALALLRDRMDRTLQTPDDLERQLDLPVLGTTTSSHALKPAVFAEQIAGDYQTIRANLGMQYDGGMPRRLVVSSAGTREGKTTFAVNLATSLAKSGRKVLLIDGDMRKPEVAKMLNVPKETGYLQDVLLGGGADSPAYELPTSGLHVLAANPRHMADPYELLNSSMAAEQLERLARQYDHLVIDSPPALAFPDALVWGRLADAVVLVTLAGQTRIPDLKEAKERFVRGRARVLGAVLSNVPMDQSQYRYAQTYRVRSASAQRQANGSKKLLLAGQNPDDESRKA